MIFFWAYWANFTASLISVTFYSSLRNVVHLELHPSSSQERNKSFLDRNKFHKYWEATFVILEISLLSFITQRTSENTFLLYEGRDENYGGLTIHCHFQSWTWCRIPSSFFCHSYPFSCSFSFQDRKRCDTRGTKIT